MRQWQDVLGVLWSSAGRDCTFVLGMNLTVGVEVAEDGGSGQTRASCLKTVVAGILGNFKAIQLSRSSTPPSQYSSD